MSKKMHDDWRELLAEFLGTFVLLPSVLAWSPSTS